MFAYTAEILYRSLIFIKGMNPQKIGAAEKKTIARHIALWNIILLNFGGDNDEDILHFIENDKILSKNISLKFENYSHDEMIIPENSRALELMKNILTKINIISCSEKCDHKILIKYVREMHNLPRCFLSVSDPAKISEDDALAYSSF